MSVFTYGHFARTGAQDCQNVISSRDAYEAWRALGRPSDPEAAINVVRAVWSDEASIKADWLAQNAGEFDGLDPERCYTAWRDAWQTTAVGYVRTWMQEWCSMCGSSLAGNCDCTD